LLLSSSNVAFASPVRLSPRIFENPVYNETGFFVLSPALYKRERDRLEMQMGIAMAKAISNSIAFAIEIAIKNEVDK
jgi:hypothetical protein